MSLTIVTALLMAVGLVGIVVPVLPGLVLIWLATALWAYDHPAPAAWVVFVAASVVYAVGLGVQYLLPGRRLRAAGVHLPTLLLAAALAVLGFFVVPVVGALLGFVVGIFAVELVRRREPGAAWRSTRHALRAVALSVGLELAAGFAIVLVWVVGLWRLGTGS